MAQFNTIVLTSDTKKISAVGVDHSYYHPLLGNVILNNNNLYEGIEENQKAQYDDYVLRETGLSEEIQNNNNVIQGLANPGDYLNSRNVALYDMGKDLSILYRREFTRLSREGRTEEGAKKEALKYIEQEKVRRNRDIDSRYPLEVVHLAKKRLEKKN